LHSKGADDLFGLILAAVEKEINKLADKKRVAEKCVHQKEIDDFNRSVTIHNANQLVMGRGYVERRVIPVDQVKSI
jgi:hypothetical protein